MDALTLAAFWQDQSEIVPGDWLPTFTVAFVKEVATQIGRSTWSSGTLLQQIAIGSQTLVLLVNIMSVITNNNSKGPHKGASDHGHIVLTPPTTPPLYSCENGVVWRAASNGVQLLESMLDVLAVSMTSRGGFKDVLDKFDTELVLAKLGVRVGDIDASKSSWCASATATIEAGMKSLFNPRGISQSTVMTRVMLAVLELLLHAARVHAVDDVESMPPVTEDDTDLFVLEFKDLMTNVRKRADVRFKPTDLDVSEDLASVTERLTRTRTAPSPESAQWYSLCRDMINGETLQPEIVMRLGLTIFFDADDDILISTLASYNEVGTVFHRESSTEFIVAHGGVPNSACYQLQVLSSYGRTQRQPHTARTGVSLHVLLIRREDFGASDVLDENLPTAYQELDLSIALRLPSSVEVNHTELLEQMTGIDWIAFAMSRYVGRRFADQQGSVDDKLKINGPADTLVVSHAREQLQKTLESDDASIESKKSTSKRETDLYAGVATTTNGPVALLQELTSVHVDILVDLSTGDEKAKGILKAMKGGVAQKTITAYFAKYARTPAIDRAKSMIDRAEEKTGASASDSHSNSVSLRNMDVQRLTDKEEGLSNLAQLLFCSSPDVRCSLETIIAAKAPTKETMSALAVLTGKMFENAARALEQHWLAWPTNHPLSGEFIRTHTTGLVDDAKAEQVIEAAEPEPQKRKVTTVQSDDHDNSESGQEASADDECVGRERTQTKRFMDEVVEKKSSKKKKVTVYPVGEVLDMTYDQIENAGKALVEWEPKYGPEARDLYHAHAIAASRASDRYTYQFKMTTELRQWNLIESHKSFKAVKDVYDSSIPAVRMAKRKRSDTEPVDDLLLAIQLFKVDNPALAAQLEQVLNDELNAEHEPNDGDSF